MLKLQLIKEPSLLPELYQALHVRKRIFGPIPPLFLSCLQLELSGDFKHPYSSSFAGAKIKVLPRLDVSNGDKKHG